MSNLRRTSDLALRNSAKCTRNFGRSVAPFGKRMGVAQSRPRRLFIKNTAICEPAMGRIGGDTCPVPEG
jgi:hypothetical protein